MRYVPGPRKIYKTSLKVCLNSARPAGEEVGRKNIGFVFCFFWPWDISHLVGLEFRLNLPHRMVPMVEYAAGNDLGRFSHIMSS